MSINEACQQISSLNTNKSRTLASLLQYDDQHNGRVFPNQTNIARRAGLTHSVAQKALYSLRDKGIVSWYQGHAPTPEYDINPIFKHYQVRKVIHDKIKNFFRLKTHDFSSSSGGVLLNINGVNINQHQQYERVTTTRASSVVGWGDDGGDEKIEKEAMTENPIPQCILNVTQKLGLTKWGQMELTKYPDAAIDFAAKQLNQAGRNLKNPFGYFLSECKKFCEANGLEIEWRKAKSLQESYSMPFGASLILDKAASVEKERTQKSPQREGSGPSAYEQNKSCIDASFADMNQRVKDYTRGTQNWSSRHWNGVSDEVAKARDIAFCEEKGIAWKESWFSY